ncbi:MAG: cation diffusion facilitator family transporter [Lachnospiraceae bacterium]|nr:cation diffusion facilitator family transporter [Lachnospiraceae bacterium]
MGDDRLKKGTLISAIGLGCNILLAVLKIIIGMVSGMISITADALNNFSDSVSSIVSLIGFKISSKPADDEHPFGHARYEYISGLVVAFLVMMVGVELIQSSIEKIIHPTEIDYSIWMYLVLILSITVKTFMMIMYTVMGRRIKSTVMVAASKDSLFDVITTTTVLIGTFVSMTWHVELDGIMGLMVALFIVYSGVGLVMDTLNPLIGVTPEAEMVDELEKKILGYEDVLGAHDLMVHDYGPNHCFASIHVEIAADKTMLECHDIVDVIERDVEQEFGINLVIHADPVVMDGSEVAVLREFIISQSKEIDEGLKIHEVRVISGKVKKLFFDCRIPQSARMGEHEVCEELKKRITAKYPDYEIHIRIDHSLVALNKPEEN